MIKQALNRPGWIGFGSSFAKSRREAQLLDGCYESSRRRLRVWLAPDAGSRLVQAELEHYRRTRCPGSAA